MIEVVAYTDGGCRGNPGLGGWGMLLVDPRSRQALERAGGVAQTTNNRMEMLAAIEALRSVKRAGSVVLVCTDSRYLIDCCSKWMRGWKKRGWARKDGPLKNVDLLKELDALIVHHEVRWQWVPGHAGEPGNERVDALANLAMDRVAAGQDAMHEQRVRWTAPLPT